MRILRSNGQDGVLDLSSPTTLSPISAACGGTSATNALSASNASFSAGQMIFIYAARGSGCGYGEFNIIDSYNHGTGEITTIYPLERTYVSSGAQRAFVQVVPQYSQVTNNTTLTLAAWDGLTGGLNILNVAGRIWNKSGATIDGKGKGYRGGTSTNGAFPNQGQCGEGTGGDRAYQQGANGSGGGGGRRTASGGSINTGGGGGGAHQTGATAGINIGGASTGGAAGVAVGGTDFQTDGIFMGGGGGAGADNNTGNITGLGRNGGAALILLYDELINEGTIRVDGVENDGGEGDSNQDGDGAPGAGGSLWGIGTKIPTVGTITGIKGARNTGGKIGQCGSAADGRMQFDICSGSPSTNPSATKNVGGHDFCQSVIHIYG